MAVDSAETLRTEKIIVQHRAPAGSVAGILGCIFGLLGIFVSGLIFVPLAALCAITGFVRGVTTGSVLGIGLSAITGFMCFIGFAVSPSLWILLGAAFLTSSPIHHATSAEMSVQNHMSESQSYGPSAPTQEEDSTDPTSTAPPAPIQEDISEEANSLILRMQKFDALANQYIAEMPAEEAKYQAITAKMDEYLRRERALVTDPNASVTRGQFSVAISQGSIATDQIHNQAQVFGSQLRISITPLDQSVASFKLTCQRISDLNADNESAKASCQNFDNAVAISSEKFQELSSGFSHLEDVYQREHDKQDGLVTESQRLE